MQFLELKIPPPIAAVAVGALMWCLALVPPSFDAPSPVRHWFAPAIALVGIALTASGAITFRRAKTTTNPMKPAAASSLVLSGAYRITRNPMYVGLVLALVAWALFLSWSWALVGPLLFAIYIHRFQIAPEEKALELLFVLNSPSTKRGFVGGYSAAAE